MIGFNIFFAVDLSTRRKSRRKAFLLLRSNNNISFSEQNISFLGEKRRKKLGDARGKEKEKGDGSLLLKFLIHFHSIFIQKPPFFRKLI